jgi:Fur family transcriptional regulator, ferric uptake regulator
MRPLPWVGVRPRRADESRYHLERMPVQSHEREWADSTSSALLAKGLRNGQARRAVIDLLAEQNCCLTAQELFDRLRASGRPVGIASIYRTLELLTGEGYVQRIDLGSGIARYEPVGVEADHHHHLVCDTCGKVEAFEDHALELALARLEETSGYDVAGHDVVLRGTCRDCRPVASATA